MNGIQRAVAILGGNTNLARVIGRRPQEITKWLRRGWVTPGACGAIAEAVLLAIPLAKRRGVDVETARPVTLRDLNPGLPDVLPVVSTAAEEA